MQLSVFDGDAQFGFFSIAVTRVGGNVSVALAAQAQKGIWLSNQAGLGRTFELWWSPPNADAISVLRVQRSGARAFLWAGFGASGDDTGKGAARIEIIGASKAQSAQSWDSFDGWSGQGVRELAFNDTTVFAASLSRGVVRLDLRNSSPTWRPLSARRRSAGAFAGALRRRADSEALRAGDDRCGFRRRRLCRRRERRLQKRRHRRNVCTRFGDEL